MIKRRFSFFTIVMTSLLALVLGSVLSIFIPRLPSNIEFTDKDSTECDVKLAERTKLLNEAVDRAFKLNDEKTELMAKLKSLEDKICK